MQYPRLCEKHRDTIISSEKKSRELVKEIDQAKKQIEEGESKVRELTLAIQNELSVKLKAVVKISL